MSRSRRWIPILATGLIITLMPAGSPAVEKGGLSPRTHQLLKERQLQKLARQDAREAIRELDRWRSAAERLTKPPPRQDPSDFF